MNSNSPYQIKQKQKILIIFINFMLSLISHPQCFIFLIFGFFLSFFFFFFSCNPSGLFFFRFFLLLLFSYRYSFQFLLTFHQRFIPGDHQFLIFNHSIISLNIRLYYFLFILFIQFYFSIHNSENFILYIPSLTPFPLFSNY